MSFDRTSIERNAAETGFAPATIEKVVRLGELLADVQRHPLLSRVLVLKGGTPLNLGFGAPARLSVDLDFNYVGHLEREAMLAERPEVERAIETIAGAQGYAIQRSADAHAGRKIYLAYRNTSGGPDRIEVDVNYIHRLCLLDRRPASIWQPAGRPAVEATILALEELVAGKLAALFSRRSPRDMFDAARIPGILGAHWLEGVTRPLFTALAGSLERPYYHRARERLLDTSQGDLEAELAPMLQPESRLDATNLRVRAWRVIKPLTEPTPAEREFTERLQGGEIVPELLFPENAPIAERLRLHPVLRWKAKNAAAHRTGRPGAMEETP